MVAHSEGGRNRWHAFTCVLLKHPPMPGVSRSTLREIPRMRNATLAILLTLFVSTTAAVRADDAPKGDKPPGDKGGDKAAAVPAAPRKFVTHHRFTAGGVDVPYTATATDIDPKDRHGKPQ